MYLLDTNVLSELRKTAGGRGSPAVAAWAKGQDHAGFFLSTITLTETEIGIRLLERRDPVQSAILRGWMNGAVLPYFAERTIPVDTEVALAAASFHVPDPAPFADSLIAATALIHGLTVATRNAADFRRFPGVTVLNPWEHPLPAAGAGEIS